MPEPTGPVPYTRTVAACRRARASAPPSAMPWASETVASSPASRVRVPSGTPRSALAGKSASTPAAANSPMIRSAVAAEIP